MSINENNKISASNYTADQTSLMSPDTLRVQAHSIPRLPVEATQLLVHMYNWHKNYKTQHMSTTHRGTEQLMGNLKLIRQLCKM